MSSQIYGLSVQGKCDTNLQLLQEKQRIDTKHVHCRLDNIVWAKKDASVFTKGQSQQNVVDRTIMSQILN